MALLEHGPHLAEDHQQGPELPITGEAQRVQCHCRCGQECHRSPNKYQGWSVISSVHLAHFLVDSGYSQITTTALDGSRVATNTDGACLLESIKRQKVRNSAKRGNAWKRSVPTSILCMELFSLCMRCLHK